ncbi:prepilin-type N-terminal cleavage/methylation domain-containing protein [Alkalihalophilus pseudofirmus]|uniref:Prepilin-type N-terminal cleavage/methylation domain-containing protein n=1 Tax=Alkalihalophilus pseudofirmus TaxID=79885 RepID=A0AAJ2U300_ALKPS|nr:prepilin-type N-terminal cleavage/methylation domain-containing protein [Alkalihalophilus pseudofirmus]MDV2886227.1 prepilin-type N-terminal cleavage/methylation domain-containing protein [Alkalihalophilus pseudofirmus]
MLTKYIVKEKGLTLLEVLATIVISSLFIGIIYNVLLSTFSFNEKTSSHITLRQEANIMMTQLREQHKAGYDDVFCYDDFFESAHLIEHIELNELSPEGTTITTNRRCGDLNADYNLNVNMKLTDSHNPSFEIQTTLESQYSSSVTPINPGPDPEPESSFLDYLRKENVLFFGNVLDFTGNGTVIGPEATVVMRNGFSSNSGSKTSIKAKNIYIQGNLDLKHITLGHSSESTIYVGGDILTGNLNQVDINGKILYTGSITGKDTLPHKDSYSLEKVDSISFPDFTVPDVENQNWYTERGYTVLNDQTTYRKQISNQTIYASKGNVRISSNTRGIIFAPDGNVTIDNNATFTGVIIAKSIDIKGTVVYEPLPADAEVPFN